MKARCSFVAVILVAVLVGCSKGASVVGKWKMDAPQVVDAPGQPTGFMTGFASTFKYEFKQDGTFTAPMSEGKYTVSGNSVSITTTKLMGQDISKFGGNASAPQMTGELSADGSTLTLHPPASPMIPDALKGGVKMVRDSG